MSLFPFSGETRDKLLSGRHWGQLGLHPMADPESPVLGFAMMDVLGVDGVVVEDVVVNRRIRRAITHMDSRKRVSCGICSVRHP